MLQEQTLPSITPIGTCESLETVKEGIPLAQNAWVEIPMTVGIFNHVGKKDPLILIGPKAKKDQSKENHCEGMWVAPGGKFAERSADEKPETAVECARREGTQESGLTGGSNMQVAEVRVNIIEQRLRLVIYIVLFSDWTGTLKWNEEFEWLKFIPFSQIPRNKLPPGDYHWLRRVLIKGKPTLARIHCGKDRNDVLSISCEDLHRKYEDFRLASLTSLERLKLRLKKGPL